MSEFGKMEQAWDLFGDHEGAVQSLGSNINSAFLHSWIALTCSGDGPSAQHAAELSADPSSACCSPIKSGRVGLRADALALSAWQGQVWACGLPGALQHWLLCDWRCLCTGEELLPVRVSLCSLPSPYNQISRSCSCWLGRGCAKPHTAL